MCVSDAMVSVCVSRCVCVLCVIPLACFKVSSGCLFRPHHVNQGGVQRVTPQVTLYEPHTAEESHSITTAKWWLDLGHSHVHC